MKNIVKILSAMIMMISLETLAYSAAYENCMWAYRNSPASTQTQQCQMYM
jgi:hypothetical protein